MSSDEIQVEQTLLAQWVQGDRAAGDELLRRLLPGIYGLCLRILRREAEAQDAAQEAFARLCAQLRRRRDIREVRKWTATVAMNLCLDMRRRRGRELPIEPGGLEDDCSEPIDELDREELQRKVAELPERYRLVLHHRFALELKPSQIAEVMGIENGSARVLLHRALSALRRKFRK